jgi:PhnB protein
MTISTKSVPEGMHTLTPHLVCANCADAIEFYKKAFGAEAGMRMDGENGKIMHASMKFGDSVLMLMDEFPEWGAKGPKLVGGTSVTIHMIVDDVDAAFAQAIAAGAKEVMPVADQFWGDRYGVLEDPFGHSWSLATPKQQLSEEEIRANMAKMEPMQA